MSNFLFCDCGAKWQGIAPLFLRLATGAIFAMHGYQKLNEMGVEQFAGFLDSLGVPAAMFFAWVVITVELIGGIALIIGVLTRFLSILLCIDMLVAFFLVHLEKGFYLSNGGYEFVMILFASALALSMTGAGALSLDSLFCGNKKPLQKSFAE
ncbi:MAG: DoxX family protein [bacterium]|nr:DoxX family protein [bacterium]